MANGIRRYELDAARLAQGLLDGFTLGPGGVLAAGPDRRARRLFLPALDGGEAGFAWGRLSLRARLDGEAALSVRACASDDAVFLRNGALCSIDGFLLSPGEAPEAKAALFSALGGEEVQNARDVLLYRHKGRYLWLWVEVDGGEGAALDGLRVLVPGDNFFGAFPAVYQTEGGFFHRWLSILSTLYANVQDEVDALPALADPERAPAGMLPLLARWLGIETEGAFLSEGELRALLRLAPALLDAKGTRRSVELAAGLFVSGDVFVVEHNLLTPRQRAEGGGLYGGGPYDFALLLPCAPDEHLSARLTFLLRQLLPAQSRMRLCFLRHPAGLDAYAYLDENALLLAPAPGALDGGAASGLTCLD